MKFDQLIEYNMINIFLESSHTNYGGQTIPNQNGAHLQINSLEVYAVCFYCFPS